MNDITNNDADGSPRTAAAQKRARDAAAIGLTEDASPEKGQNVAAAIAKEFICPITHELPIEPVTAEDGKVYERAAIELWFETKEGDPTSPMTGAVIGTELIPAPHIRKAIEAHIESGAIKGKIAEAWTKKLEQEKEVKALRANAEGGDGESMWKLGVFYESGEYGLAKDDKQARAWYERSAATRHPKGMASVGECLLCGFGGPQNDSLGFVNLMDSAHLGSDFGAYLLGQKFFKGICGLPKDPVRARYWLEKAIGECEVNNLSDADLAEAARWLRELQDD